MTTKPAPDYPVITITPDSGGGGGGGVTVHSDLTGRTTTNQHPGTAISLTAPPGTGNLATSVVNAQLLQAAVDALVLDGGSVIHVFSANYAVTGDTPLESGLFEFLPSGSKLLLPNQTDPTENGLWVSDGSDTLTRVDDFNVTPGVQVLISVGVRFAQFSDIPGTPIDGFTVLLPASVDFSAGPVTITNHMVTISEGQVVVDSSGFGQVLTTSITTLDEALAEINAIDLPNGNLPAYAPGDNAFAVETFEPLVEDDGGVIKLLAIEYQGHELNPNQVFIQMGSHSDSTTGFWKAPAVIEVGGVCTRPTFLQDAAFEDVTHNHLIKIADSDTYGQSFGIVRGGVSHPERRDVVYPIYLVPANVLGDDIIQVTPSALSNGSGKVQFGYQRTTLTVTDLTAVATVATGHIILDTVASGGTAVSVELADDSMHPIYIEHTGVTGNGFVANGDGTIIELEPGDVVIASCSGGSTWSATKVGVL